MSQQYPPPGPPTAPWGPPPPAPKKSSAGKVIGIIVGVLAAFVVLLGGCAVLVDSASNDIDDTTPSKATASGDKPAADDGENGGDTVDLTDKVTYDNGVQVQLSKFTRGTSGEYASPGQTDYIKFTVSMTNGSKKTVDATMLTVQCQYGTSPAHQGDQVFDTGNGLDIPPTTHVTPGNSISYVMACVMPKDEQRLQVEVSPDIVSDTALFVGKIK